MKTDLTSPRFTNEDAARAHIEASRWPNEVNCPLCGSLNVHRMAGKTQAGMFLCNDCRDKFTCRTGTVMERSHIPLHKWLLAIHLMASSKKGISAHRLMRNLGLGSYRTAWFLAHRIREAMGDTSHRDEGGLGGANKAVEVAETYVGGKAKNRAHAPKKAVVSLVEREGRVHSKHVADVTANTVREVVVTNANPASVLMSDEAKNLSEDRRRVRQSSDGKPLSQRVRAPWRLRSHQHGREFLFDPEARDHGCLSLSQRNAFASPSERV